MDAAVSQPIAKTIAPAGAGGVDRARVLVRVGASEDGAADAVILARLFQGSSAGLATTGARGVAAQGVDAEAAGAVGGLGAAVLVKDPPLNAYAAPWLALEPNGSNGRK